jgi:hypothetical protein
VEQRAYIVRISPLELTMRDVREGMADYAAGFGFDSVPGVMEILSIEPAPEERPRARVIPYRQHPSR